MQGYQPFSDRIQTINSQTRNNVSRTSLDPPPGRGTAGQRIRNPVVGDTTPDQRVEGDPRGDELAGWLH